MIHPFSNENGVSKQIVVILKNISASLIVSNSDMAILILPTYIEGGLERVIYQNRANHLKGKTNITKLGGLKDK